MCNVRSQRSNIQLCQVPYLETQSSYANDLHTRQNFRFCDKSLEFLPKCRKSLTETKEIHYSIK